MRRYYVLIFLIIFVAVIFSSSFGTKLEALSPIIQGLAMLAFIIPTCLLLHLIGKDKRIKNGLRIVAKIGIVFFNLLLYRRVISRICIGQGRQGTKDRGRFCILRN